MTNGIVAICLVTMSIVAVIRMPGMRHSPVHLMIWLALVSGSISASIGQPAARAWLFELSGQHWVALALEMVLALVTMAAVLNWLTLAESAGRRRPQRHRLRSAWVRTGIIAVTVTVTAAVNNLETVSTYTAIGNDQGSLAQIICVSLYEGNMIYTFAQTTVMFFALGRATASRWTRYILYMIAVSTIGSQGRSIYTMVYLLLPSTALPPWSTPLSATINLPSNAVGCVGIALLGSAGAIQWFRTRRDLRAITPLWQAIRAAYPTVVRVPDKLPTGPRLVAAVTEIHDALSRLAGWKGSPAILRSAREAAAQAGVPSHRVEAAAQAAWIAQALRTRLDTSQTEHTAWTYGASADDDMAGGVSWLAQVAHEFQHNPFVDTFASRTTHSSAPTGT
ncbi:MAB_1171c family putative transporter [Nonomuraea sp. NPDC023979]|uniref:MAB_1171c family putative transporter n=1 Tax=Nonomuraea sp. NPDC023979 TaxID=3154796 RepID=UPI0033D33B1E